MKKPHPTITRRRRRSRLLSFLLCSSANHHRNANNPAAFSPPRRSVLEYDDDDESISNETIIGSSKKDAQDSVETGPVWSMGSLASRFQNTPSPVCSTCSPVRSDSSGSGVNYNFSTPRNQSPSKVSVSTVDIDDWIRAGRKQHPSQHNAHPTRGDEGKTWMSCSSVYESAIGGIDQVTLASIHEEEIHEHDEEESPFLPYHKLLSRPKPYHEFLNEVEKQGVEFKVNAWDQALRNDNIDKCRKREAAIREWEMKQTMKAARELEELESKQKKELAKAMEKLQQKMIRIQSKAAEKKSKGRLSCVSSDEANIYSSMSKLSM